MMHSQRYEELDDRRAMLRLLHTRLESYDELEMELKASHIQRMGEELELSPKRSVQLFMRLIDEGYVRTQRTTKGTLYQGHASTPFVFATVLSLTDKGLRLINLLPPEDPIESIRVVLEAYAQRLEQEQIPDAEKERRRGVIRQFLSSLGDLGRELGPKLAAELISKGLGM